MSDFVETQDTGNASWVDNLTQGAQAYQAWEIAQLNIDRAKQGLPPINAAAYSPQVNVGLSTQTMWLIGLGIAAAVLLRR